MAIIAKFATSEESTKKIKKTPQFGTDVPISAYEEVDDLTCDFILDGHGYHGYNYMQVTWDTGRVKYYFIENRTGMPGDMTRIRCVCDVLRTYKDTILASPAVLNRTSDQKYTDTFLKDNQITTRAVTELDAAAIAENVISDTEYVYVGILQKVASKGAV